MVHSFISGETINNFHDIAFLKLNFLNLKNKRTINTERPSAESKKKTNIQIMQGNLFTR